MAALTTLDKLRLIALPRRLEILAALDRASGALRVSEILKACESSTQPEISQQLRVLKDAGIVDAERKGTSVYYRIIDQELIGMLIALQRCWQGEHR